MKIDLKQRFKIALSWCLAWGSQKEPQFNRSILHEMRKVILENQPVPEEVEKIVRQVDNLQSIEDNAKPLTIKELRQIVGDLWEEQTPIGLVYGGATKIKQYVFESANLMEIRGASAILDRINLVDLPAFFGERDNNNDLQTYRSAQSWLDKEFPRIRESLIPELIIYSTGGNILAFCPAAYVNDLANAIEKRYTEETLTANSCAVGDTFKLLEIRFGLFNQKPEKTPWFEWYEKNINNPIIKAYYGQIKNSDRVALINNFFERKSFNELTGKLAIQFNQRRSGNLTPGRLSRSYPPMLETHPYLRRDDNDRTSAIAQVERLPSEPHFSEPLARKYRTGQVIKRDNTNDNWLKELEISWEPGYVDSWVTKFREYLDHHPENIYDNRSGEDAKKNITEARSLEEIANASENFVSFIYADGNNMGGYIQKIKTPEEYHQFSKDVFEATEQSVYYALAQNLHPHWLIDLKKPESQSRNDQWIHPFEIITIGGDDVLLIIPANQALNIAKDIGEKFAEILESKGDRYRKPPQTNHLDNHHRYKNSQPVNSDCILSTSLGVLTVAYNTPIYYAQNLTSQLLKSAKEYAKALKKSGYYGGTIDTLTLKSVTMISSSIKQFRKEGLIKPGKPQLKLYASPYTLHEIGGLIQTIIALKKADFPRSQLYQIRALLERGKRTAMLNYHYFRSRLKPEDAKLLKEHFEEAWCKPKEEDNYGSLAPWMSIKEAGKDTIYETIWREIIDHYPFIEVEAESESSDCKPAEVEP